MTLTKRISGLFGMLAGLFWLAGCSSATPTNMPTPDLNPIRTEAAATVFAQVTRDLALTPSITPMPSATATPLVAPTLTSTPTFSVNLSPTVTGTISSPTPTIELPNLAQWVSQSIADDTLFSPGETFTMTWTLRNVGQSTWTIGYMLRFFSGDTFGAPTEILLGREVLPGGTIDIIIPMRAPVVAGNYRSDWVLANEKRSNFKEPVFLKIIVVAPPTRTPTPSRTPSPTP